jgi:excisionase family DNA binding protein
VRLDASASGRTEAVMVERLLLTPTEAAQALGIGRAKVYELLMAGVIESVLIGSARRVPADAVVDYVRRLRHQLAL